MVDRCQRGQRADCCMWSAMLYVKELLKAISANTVYKRDTLQFGVKPLNSVIWLVLQSSCP